MPISTYPQNLLKEIFSFQFRNEPDLPIPDDCELAIKYRLHSLQQRFSVRDLAILETRFRENKNYTSIGKEYALTGERIKAICDKIIRIMRLLPSGRWTVDYTDWITQWAFAAKADKTFSGETYLNNKIPPCLIIGDPELEDHRDLMAFLYRKQPYTEFIYRNQMQEDYEVLRAFMTRQSPIRTAYICGPLNQEEYMTLLELLIRTPLRYDPTHPLIDYIPVAETWEPGTVIKVVCNDDHWCLRKVDAKTAKKVY